MRSNDWRRDTRRTLAPVILLAMLLGNAEAAMKTEAIEYKHGDAALEGYLAYDDAIGGKRPGVAVVHEWWGLNPYVKKRVDQLARMGYIAFALDMYGKGKVTRDPKEATEWSAPFRNDRAFGRARAAAGLAVLKNHRLTDVRHVAAIGYCFGGTSVLEMARGGADLAGVASFHGGLDTPEPAKPGAVKAKVLVLAGGDDPFVPPVQVAAFEEEMRQAGADWQVILYGGALHSFTNPEADGYGLKGAGYNERADRRSWEAMKVFFAEIFK
jgi:dienelactone hydrolase